jgi:hypothetical protein
MKTPSRRGPANAVTGKRHLGHNPPYQWRNRRLAMTQAPRRQYGVNCSSEMPNCRVTARLSSDTKAAEPIGQMALPWQTTEIKRLELPKMWFPSSFPGRGLAAGDR